MTRVLFIHPGDDSYGVDRVALQVVRALRDAGHEVDCLLDGTNPGNGWLSTQLRADNISFRRCALGVMSRATMRQASPAVRWAGAAAAAFGRVFGQAGRYEVVYVNGFTVAVAAIAARARHVPVVWHLHEVPPHPGLCGRVTSAVAAREICVSAAVAAELHPYGLPPRCRVIHNAVEPGSGVEFERGDAALLRVGIIARINRWKGHMVLVEACRRLAAQGGPVALTIVGAPHPSDTRHAEALRAQVATMPEGSVEWRGEMTSSADILSDLDVVVAPSVEPEPFGLSVLEAMAAGLPVVASDLGGHRETVVDGVTGFLVPPGDVTSLAEALRRLAGDPELRLRMGRAGRQRAATEFSPARFRAEIVQVVTEVAR